MQIDLHCHTIHSDGVLTPAALISRAIEKGVEVLSITDHDTMAAYHGFVGKPALRLIPGIELSTSWKNLNVHIVGLNVDPHSKAMQEATTQQSESRRQRAHLISQALQRKGISNTLEGAMELAGNSQIGRPHFARHLVSRGICQNLNKAYKQYLGAGKIGDIKNLWANLETVIQWILDAGGIPVLAHPAKYKLTRTRLTSLVSDFTSQGGQALEVVSGSQNKDVTDMLATLTEQFALMSSCGSDFHTPENSWSELGRFLPLPSNCRPVWEQWQ